jgi:hypothetical protein
MHMFQNVTLMDAGLYLCHAHVTDPSGRFLVGRVRLNVFDKVVMSPWETAMDYKVSTDCVSARGDEPYIKVRE